VTQGRNPRVHERWARLRFSIVGQLLAAPPQKGGLRSALAALAAREWRHPPTGKPTRFGLSKICSPGLTKNVRRAHNALN
jgi:putative transposase